MRFADGSISIMPADTDPGYGIEGIGYSGTQNQLKMIDQILDSLTVTSPSVISTTDSIVQAIQKIIPTLPNYFTAIHITSGSPSTTNLTALQSCIIVDGSVTGKNIVLPTSSDPNVIIGWHYRFTIMGGSVTSNTIKVVSGDHLNTTLNGTFTIAGLLSGQNSVTAVSDGAGWYISP